MNALKLLLIWRKLVAWLRTLLTALGRKEKVDWPKKVNDLTAIVNEALDVQGVPELPKNSPPATKTKRRWFGRGNK